MVCDYNKFLKSKEFNFNPKGIEIIRNQIHNKLFDFQKDIVLWALRKGRCALFEDCGLGKTFQQIQWAHFVHIHTGRPVLILAPLAVSMQTIQEAKKLNIHIKRCESQNDVIDGINISNYERIEKFIFSIFSGIVLDESSILKSFSGKIRNQLIDLCQRIPYRLACTATPSPNDFQELGNHAEFLGVMSRMEMLSMFFINDTANTGTWRLKGHANKEFWKWVSTWAVMINKPSDLGYDDENFILPEINYHEIVIDYGKPLPGELFIREANTLSERRQVRKESIDIRAVKTAEIANKIDDSIIVWCDLNAESEALKKVINQSDDIKGSDNIEQKEFKLNSFTNKSLKVLITKPSIAGFGMNWQHCNKVFFVGLSDSYEMFYQAVRRCWRFGQERPVDVFIVSTTQDGKVLENIKRKEKNDNEMRQNMLEYMADAIKDNIHTHGTKIEYQEEYDFDSEGEYSLFLGDNVEILKSIDPDSIDFSIFSPPFASLFTYSNSLRDMGNVKSDDEFFAHFNFMSKELYRIIRPGRLIAFHCMNLSTTIQHHGYIGIRDFRGDLIYHFQKHGFIFHSEVCIWKDPLVAATRTKALGLAHKQISKDSSMCRQGLPDYLIVMRKPGQNDKPVSKGRGFERYIGSDTEPNSKKTDNPRTNKYSHHVWQRYASPVWFDIRQTYTLNTVNAKDDHDEKHICPLQLDVIERAIDLWTNPGDLVLDPFNGIGSTGYIAVKNKRKYIGIELKKSYFDESIKNLKKAKIEQDDMPLFKDV